MKLADKLVCLRKKQGLSQLKLAEIMNVSRQAISRWETGIAVPSAENLKYLGNLYNVSLAVAKCGIQNNRHYCADGPSSTTENISSRL